MTGELHEKRSGTQMTGELHEKRSGAKIGHLYVKKRPTGNQIDLGYVSYNSSEFHSIK